MIPLTTGDAEFMKIVLIIAFAAMVVFLAKKIFKK